MEERPKHAKIIKPTYSCEGCSKLTMVRYVTTCFDVEIKLCLSCLDEHIFEGDQCYLCHSTFKKLVNLKICDTT